MDSNAYSSVHQSSPNSDIRIKLLQTIVSQHLGEGLISDIGCGSGYISSAVADNRHQVMAIDISAESIRRLHALRSSLYVAVMDANNLGIRGDILDNAIVLDLLEHLQNEDRCIKEVYRTLKKNGKLILNVPAIRKLYGIRDRIARHHRR